MLYFFSIGVQRSSEVKVCKPCKRIIQIGNVGKKVMPYMRLFPNDAHPVLIVVEFIGHLWSTEKTHC